MSKETYEDPSRCRDRMCGADDCGNCNGGSHTVTTCDNCEENDYEEELGAVECRWCEGDFCPECISKEHPRICPECYSEMSPEEREEIPHE